MENPQHGREGRGTDPSPALPGLQLLWDTAHSTCAGIITSVKLHQSLTTQNLTKHLFWGLETVNSFHNWQMLRDTITNHQLNGLPLATPPGFLVAIKILADVAWRTKHTPGAARIWRLLKDFNPVSQDWPPSDLVWMTNVAALCLLKPLWW